MASEINSSARETPCSVRHALMAPRLGCGAERVNVHRWRRRRPDTSRRAARVEHQRQGAAAFRHQNRYRPRNRPGVCSSKRCHWAPSTPRGVLGIPLAIRAHLSGRDHEADEREPEPPPQHAIDIEQVEVMLLHVKQQVAVHAQDEIIPEPADVIEHVPRQEPRAVRRNAFMLSRSAP